MSSPGTILTGLMIAMVNAGDRIGSRPLHRAVSAVSYRATAMILLVHPTAPMIPNKYQTTPFNSCLGRLPPERQHRSALIPLLLRTCPQLASLPCQRGNYPLHEVVHLSDLKIIRCVYDLFPEAIRLRNALHCTPIHVAVSNRSDIALEYLLSQWPDGVKEPNQHGALPIHMAVMSSQMSTVQLLLRIWPDSATWPMSHCKSTPLHHSVRTSCLITKLLLSHAPPEALMLRDANGRTPLHVAVAQFSSSISIKRMLRRNPDAIKATESDTGNSVFHMAARYCRVEMMKMFIDLWPEGLMQRNAEGRTPFQMNRSVEYASLATETSRRRMALLLQGDNAGSMLQRRTEDGNTAVHIATQSRNIEALQLLLELWPEAAHVENYAKKTPLDLATTFVELRVLCQYGAPAPVSTIMSTRRSKGLRDAKIDAIRALVQPSTGPDERKEAVRVLRLPWGPKVPSFSISATMWKKIIHAAQRPLGTPPSVPWDHFPWTASHQDACSKE